MARFTPFVPFAIASSVTLLAIGCTDPGTTPAARASAPARYWIAQAAAGDAPHARAALAAGGFTPIAVLPGGRLLVEAARGEARAAVPRTAGVASWQPWTSDDRISTELTAIGDSNASTGAEDRVPVMVHVMPGGDLAAVADQVRSLGHEVVATGASGDWQRVVALLDPALPVGIAATTAALAVDDDVFFVERIHRVGLLNDRLVGSVQSGTQGSSDAVTPIWTHGLRGEGQIVGVLDTGADPDSCYFDGTTAPRTNTWSAAGGYGTAVDASHRKIIAYDFLFSCDQYPSQNGCDDPANKGAWDNHGHGTHIGGSMIGDRDKVPGTYALHDGLAPAAKMVVQDAGYRFDLCAELPGLGCPVIDLTPLYEQAHAQGVRVINNSWGDNEEARPPNQSNYTARTQDVDRFMWNHRDFLIVFAAGNSGAGNADFSVGSPATMKNGLSVGSSRKRASGTSDDTISSFSSRGWTGDGRVKPDLMVPGCNASAGTDRVFDAPTCLENAGCGTSYAAPVAVAAAALVRQYFVDGHYLGAPLEPSAALVKAMLINSSVSMRGTDNSGGPITAIPSNEQGWGRIQLDRALAFDDSSFSLFIDDHRTGLGAGETATFDYAFDVAAGTDLKVTLVWTDFPGIPDSPPVAPKVDDPSTWRPTQLVNDLDLEVRDAAGNIYLGNQLSGGRSVAGGSPDRRNNVEQVVLAPEPGRFVVTVRAHDIAVAGQDFALVVTGNVQVANPTPPDAGVSDAAVPDASTPDATDLDASTPDAAVDAGDVPIDAALDAGDPLPDAAVDAGDPLPDAATDAGTSLPDAAIDASDPRPDAALDAPGSPDAARPDAGSGEPPEGCGCRTGTSSTSSTPALLLMAFALARRRRRA